MCVKILSDNPLFFILNSYSTGLSSEVMNYLVQTVIYNYFGPLIKNKIQVISDVIGLNVTSTNLSFPCGNVLIVNKQ